MIELPGHHLARPRLVAVAERSTVTLVEAGGGCGKTAFAIEAGRSLADRTVLVRLFPGDTAPALIVGRAIDALRRAGLDDEAQMLTDTSSTTPDTIAGLFVLQSSPVALAIDDVHHAGEDGGAFLGELAAAATEPLHLFLLGRRLPAALTRHTTDAAYVSSEDLTLTEGEITELASAHFGVGFDEMAADRVREATGGWAAAVVLTLSRMSRRRGTAGVIGGLRAGVSVVSGLIEDALAALDEGRRVAMTQFAHLPLLGPQVSVATGFADLFDITVDLGIPYTPLRDGWFELPAPIGEHLRGLGALDPAVAGAAGTAYERRGEIIAALEVLQGGGLSGMVADLVARLSPSQLSAVEPAILRSFVETLTVDAVATRPGVLLQLARALGETVEREEQRAALQRAFSAAVAAGMTRVANEARAEMAAFLMDEALPDQAAEMAREVLAAAAGDEVVARSIALHALGRAVAHDDTPDGLTRGAEILEQAVRLSERAGNPRLTASILNNLAFYVYISLGRYEQASDRLGRAVALLPPGSRRRGLNLTFRAEVLAKLGRFEEADLDLEEGLAIGVALGDERIQAYAYWQSAIGWAWRGEATPTVDALRAVERHTAGWFDHPTGAEFLADAAECCDLVGEEALAGRYLERAEAKPGNEGSRKYTRLARAAITARSGDPTAALDLFAAIDAEGGPRPEERWRMSLLKAFALHRLGRADAGEWAFRAFEEAADVAGPELPFARERRVAAALAGLAAEAGSTAAARAASSALPLHIRMLGAFEITRGGTPVTAPGGKPAEVIKMLALSEGRVGREELIEALWPEIDVDAGRRRLRVALSRARRGLGEVLSRDGEVVELLEDVSVDADMFAGQARRALAAPRGSPRAVGLARAALARYRGPLLPDDPYAEWAAPRREQLRRLYLDLLDVLEEAAQSAGDTKEALRMLERGIAEDRYDEVRYLRAARILESEGRFAAAWQMTERAREMLEFLELPLSADLEEFRAGLRRS